MISQTPSDVGGVQDLDGSRAPPGNCRPLPNADRPSALTPLAADPRRRQATPGSAGPGPPPTTGSLQPHVQGSGQAACSCGHCGHHACMLPDSLPDCHLRCRGLASGYLIRRAADEVHGRGRDPAPSRQSPRRVCNASSRRSTRRRIAPSCLFCHMHVFPGNSFMVNH